MKLNKFLTTFFVLAISISVTGQTKPLPNKLPIENKEISKNGIVKDSLGQKKKKTKKEDVQEVTIANYKIITLARDTIILDTSLNIKKEYKFNFLRRDDFELMSFANIGQAYNQLGKGVTSFDLYPKIGARSRNIGYLEVEDVNYYNVATPLTELFFKTTMERGQLLDAMLTLNTSPRFNASVAYTGMRSLGKYDYEQTQAGRFRATFNYRTLNNRYWIRGHFTAQDLEGEESGGLANKELQFESGDPNLLDRSRIDLRYANASNNIVGKRYFLDHQFNLVRPKRDSIKSRSTLLAIGHQFNYETKYYQFVQTAGVAFLGSELYDTPIDDKATLRTTYNRVTADFSSATLGRLSVGASMFSYDYALGSILITEDGTIPAQLKGDEIGIVGDYNNSLGALDVFGKVRYTMSGRLTGNLIDAGVKIRLSENHQLNGGVFISSKMPNYNFLLYQSDYANFNWNNTDTFNRERVKTIHGGFKSDWFGNLSLDYSSVDNHAYFGIQGEPTDEDLEAGLQDTFVTALQEENSITYLKAKYNKEFKFKKWALDNTVMYQKVSQENPVFNVPEFVARNTLYFSSDMFKKAMFMQTGVTFKYFSSYHMDGYQPLLGEFYTQNIEEIGGYPLLDFFINAKVRQTRLFLKAEHLNTIWSKEYQYYAAPNYPYRDFVIRFGLVWNLFS
ncbi:putative porin [Croceivirga sp. JEA036]|uniref:putative porin n=1 Tax=Croceivirga sp. JEA036 TaxID=2721162 RepID=UPI00143CA0FA|nr:putative porin [Croceivirga sp. JEA036]NJB37892.1 putative porin [Croceivirga sp. JEA036]